MNPRLRGLTMLLDALGNEGADGEDTPEKSQREQAIGLLDEEPGDAQEFVGRKGHDVATRGERGIPAGVDVSGAKPVSEIDEADQHYVGTREGLHYFQSKSTGAFVRMRRT